MGLAFMCQRELRVFPKGWVHPVDGTYITGGVRHVGLSDRDILQYVEPEDDYEYTEDDLMPAVDGLSEEETEIAAYETVSEGTPISPPFPNTPEGRFELVKWCEANASVFGTNHKADGETWAGILFGNGCAMIEDGRVVVMSSNTA